MDSGQSEELSENSRCCRRVGKVVGGSHSDNVSGVDNNWKC
jgi:hypothetical protein